LCRVHKGAAIELTLGDLLRWKPGRFRLAGALDPDSAALDREISWVVSIRATTPVLPPLRGNELVVAPDVVLEELRLREAIDWREVAGHLRTLSISGVISDHPNAVEGIDNVIVFESVSSIGPDLEMELNRELTERRSSLYQLGSNLARMYSSASLGGMDLASFLHLAEQRAGIEVALMTSTGRLLAASNADLDPGGRVDFEDLDGRRVSGGGVDWISQPVSGVGLPDGVHLVAAISPDEPGDRARLVLEQTGEALGLIFDKLPPVEAPPPGEEARQILASLAASGSLSSAARRRLTQLASDLDLDGRMRLLIDLDHPDTPPPPGFLAFPVDDIWLRLVSDDHYSQAIAGPDGRHVVSPPFVGIDRLSDIVGPVLNAHRLWRDGLLHGDSIDLGEPGSGGALAALLLVGVGDDRASGKLTAYADAMLARLESYDRARDVRLVETLGAYLDAGAVVAEAAERLGVHRNTLSYRIARIAEVSGHDLADPSTRFDLQFAVAIRRLQAG